MIGIVDVGGGNRDIFGAGILDYCIENKIDVDYFIGVSAGSANGVSYISKQKRRNYKFYTEYSKRKEYMSINNIFKRGSMVDLNYIYSTLSNVGGEYPVDYDTFFENKTMLTIVATNALTGNPTYFTKDDLKHNNLDCVKASSCVPIACKPYEINDEKYYDGGISDPIPYEKAFKDGCDKLIIILTKPKDFFRESKSDVKFSKLFKKSYSKSAEKLKNRSSLYNKKLDEIIELEKQNKVLILAPKGSETMQTFEKDSNKLNDLYMQGYKCAEKIKTFIGE